MFYAVLLKLKISGNKIYERNSRNLDFDRIERTLSLEPEEERCIQDWSKSLQTDKAPNTTDIRARVITRRIHCL